MDIALLVGYMASLCSVTSFVPQVWKVVTTGDTAAISGRMYALTVIGFALWSAFGILKTEWPIILTNSICFCLSGYILIRKLRATAWNRPCSHSRRDPNDGVLAKTLQKMPLEELLSLVGRAEPSISGSSASLLAARFGISMVRMAFAVTSKHASDHDLPIERLDSLAARLDDATEHDRAAAQALIETLRDNANSSMRRHAITEATRKPLSAAQILLELLETVVTAEPSVRQSVASDLFGGVELVKGAFVAVMMAIENNLCQDEVADLDVRTRQDRAALWSRYDVAVAALRSSLQARNSPGR